MKGCSKLKAFLGKRWDRFIFKPKDPFKVKWDIFVILLSIWNSFQIPLGFAFPEAFEDKVGYVVSDQIIDLLFMFDILINFRSCYIDSRTDELVEDTKMIAKNYIKGRFWVDLVASLNFDLIIGPFISDDQSALTDLAGMLKLVRLLRLGRMVTYLSKSKSFKLGAMMVQLFFFLILLLHWMACTWFIVAHLEDSWIPSKDLDWTETIVFTSAAEQNYFDSYVILFYYACLALLGNDYVPTNRLEIIIACTLILIGSLIIGILIGQFSLLLSDADKAKRKSNEQFNNLTSKITSLRVPEEMYASVSTYYDEFQKQPYVKDTSIYEFFNPQIKTQFCVHQLKEGIKAIKMNEISHTKIIN